MAATVAARKPKPGGKKRKATAPDAVPYKNGSSRQFQALSKAINVTTPERSPDGLMWRVPCPRCKAGIFVRLRKGRLAVVAEAEAICICSHTKHGRPPDVATGCGFKAVVPMGVG